MIFVKNQSKSAIFDRSNPMIFVEHHSISANFDRGNPLIFVESKSKFCFLLESIIGFLKISKKISHNCLICIDIQYRSIKGMGWLIGRRHI